MSNSVNLSLDVTKTSIQNPLIKVRQGDGGFETLHTTVTSNGNPLDLQGWTIVFMGTTAGNHKIVDDNVKVVEAPNGIFDYTPSKAWGADIGAFKMAYFKFVKGDGSASSANFRVNVIEAVDLTHDEAQNYISIADATIAEVKQHLTDSLASVTTSVATASSAASSLAVYVSSTASSAVNTVNTTASSVVNTVNTTASSAVVQVNSAAYNASSAAASVAAKINQMNYAPETFANLAALQAAYPNGKSGVFVTADTGHKYIWANNSWSDAGVYQSVGIADGSITNAMLAPETKTGFLVTGAPVVLSTANRTLTLTKVYQVRAGTAMYSVAASSYNLSMPENKTGFYLYYDTATRDINLSITPALPATGITLGWISISYTTAYHIMASSVVDDIENKSIKPADRVPYVSIGNNSININTTNRTLEINVPYFYIYYPNRTYSVPVSGTVNIDNGSSTSFIFYDTDTQKIVSKKDTSSPLPYTYILLGEIDWSGIYNSRFSFPATIDGIDIFKQNPSDKRAELVTFKPLAIDAKNKTISVSDGWANLSYEGGLLDIKAANPKPVDISASGSSAVYIFINVKTLVITAYSSRQGAPSGYLYLGWIDWGSLNHNFEFNVTFTGNDSLMDNPLALRKATFFGDSITWSYNPIKWANLTAQKLGATATLNAIPGSTYTVRSGATDSAVERAASITNQDLIVVWFGINDYHYGINLGTYGNSDTSTVFGAVENVLSTLISNNPNAKIMVMTPMKQHGYKSSPDSFTPNGKGLLQIDYVNAIKRVADYHSIPVLDMYTMSGMSAFDPSQATQFFRDGLHPNQAGEYRVARKVLGFIKSEL